MIRSRISRPLWLCLAALLVSSILTAAGPSTVTVREDKVVFPTYLAGAPEPNPLFFFGRSSQGAQAPVYPYAMYDALTGKKENRTYKIVYLENEYIRIGILPELGGRIFEGLDKTNNYNFFYRQHVIKPALIGLLGAWISGGVEWNIPHHHRASTFMPVQYSIEENADGSKTVWVGELEVRQRMRWAVGYTVRPGKASLEASLRIVNRTPEENSMLCFANVAVHANENYQIIFPPSTQFGTGHGKRSFQKWPISDTFPGAEPGKGIDISWYKNHIASNSVFAWNYRDDFFAGYDHGKQAGTMSIADHNIVPGKKFFTWGNGPAGRTWEKVLTDDDGPYLELMVGAYSDNQPDYSWMQPYETRSFSMSWYPFRGVGGVKKANLDAAVNLEVDNGAAKVGFYTPAAHPAATVALKVGSKILLEEKVAIDPGKPYTKQVTVPAGTDEHDLVASISDGGKELVSYSPIRLEPETMPKGTTRPPAPRDVKSNEELYLIGLRAQQFHDPAVDPMPYWQEALRRDPGDSRVNTILGITAYTKARYGEAERDLRKAIERLTDQYTTPKDAEAIYYLGATLKAAGKTDEAYTHFYNATWSRAWKGPAYYSLAEIAAGRGDMAAALEFVDRSIESDALNIRAQNLKAAVLRHMARPKEALAVLASAAHKADPLDVRSMAERRLASKTPVAGRIMSAAMNGHPATAQETAAEYLDARLWQDGLDVLRLATATATDKSKINAMVYYYMGYFAAKLNQPQTASEYYGLAASMPVDYVLPFQNEEIEVLRAAMKANPRDAHAPYYLGNLLYDWQPEEAERMWQASAALDPAFSIVHRNLATAYMHRKSGSDLDAAIAEMQKAVSLEPKYALHFTELDELYEQAGTPIERRLPLFESNAATVARRDDSQNRLVALKVAAGKYGEAIRMMTNRTFAVAEGANLNVGEQWTNAHFLRGQESIKAGRYKEAMADFESAITLPSNLPMGRSGSTRTAEFAYWTGVAYEGIGDRAKAAESWKQGAEPTPGFGARRRPSAEGAPPVTWGSAAVGAGMRVGVGAGAQAYYQALCYQKLGQTDKARQLFQSLVESGQKALELPHQSATGPQRGRPQTERARMADAHYTIGLGCLGLKDFEKAKAELSEALKTSPDLLGARSALAELM
jgi:tetratricopeptide (TPR) repeat protein